MWRNTNNKICVILLMSLSIPSHNQNTQVFDWLNDTPLKVKGGETFST